MEHYALRGLSLLAQIIYLKVFRRRMDYRTGIAGGRGCKIDYQCIADEVGFVPDAHSTRRRWLPTKGEVRAAIDELERPRRVLDGMDGKIVQLLSDAGSGQWDGYVKTLVLAVRDQSVKKQNNARTTHRTTHRTTQKESHNDNKNQTVTDSEQRTELYAAPAMSDAPPVSGSSSCTRKKKKESANALLSGNPDDGPHDAVCRVLEHLNERTGARFETLRAGRPTKAAILVGARLAEHGAEALMAVIDRKAAEWLQDPRMRQFLRPSTLFRPEKCEEYVSQLSLPARPQRPASNREVMDEWMASQHIIEGTCRHD